MMSESGGGLCFAAAVERFYAGLLPWANLDAQTGAEPSLGGSLLYAGELDAAGSALAAAGSMAGAASLAALEARMVRGNGRRCATEWWILW